MAKHYALIRVVLFVLLSLALYITTRTEILVGFCSSNSDNNPSHNKPTNQTNPIPEELNLSSNSLSGLSTDWTALHLEDKQKAINELAQVLNTNALQSRFISLNQDDEIYSFQELEQRFRPLLRDRGLVFLGDSTSRLLFGILWCTMEGVFRSTTSGTNVNVGLGFQESNICDQRLAELKATCAERDKLQASSNDTSKLIPCEFRATFTNQTSPIQIQFARNYLLGNIGKFSDTIKNNQGHFIFYMMPCLHALWSPGRREREVVGSYLDWKRKFYDFYTSLETANPGNALLLGTSVSLCDQKLGWEKDLIDLYLKDKEFVRGTPLLAFKAFNLMKTILPKNYSGPIPVLSPANQNHTCDSALFDEGGNLNCITTGLQVLSKHSLLNHPWMKVVDMHGATRFGCKDTDDGRHYSRGLTVQRELTLLLKAMESMA